MSKPLTPGHPNSCACNRCYSKRARIQRRAQQLATGSPSGGRAVRPPPSRSHPWLVSIKAAMRRKAKRRLLAMRRRRA